MNSNVVVVTVSYYSGEDVRTCVASVESAAEATVHSIVVNNARDDDLSALNGPTVTVLNTGENLGYGAAINVASRDLPDHIEWIAVTNPDTTFWPGSIDALLAVAETDARIGALGPRILNDDGTVYPSARDVPSLTAGTGHAIFHRVWPANPWSNRYLRADKTKLSDTAPVPSGWLSGSCMMVRRAAFEEVGGFDDSFFMYFEDVDLGERIGRAGWQVLYVPTATVTHTGGTTTKSHSARMLKVHHQSAYRYLAKRYHHWYQLPLRVALRAGLGLRAMVGIRRGSGS